MTRATTRGDALARNARHGLAARFGAHRVDVATGGDETFRSALTLSARAVAIDGTTLALQGARAEAPADGRVVYAHAPADGVRFDEWFRNGPLGLQHGFDVAALPAEARDLQVTVDVGEGWQTASTSGDANGAVDVHRADGRGERYAYSYLRAWDATGRFLPAKLTALDRGLQISVDVRDAALPITIDPLLQQAILVPGSTTPGSGFGFSVAVRANRALVGAPFTTVGTNAQQGVVYYYGRSPTTGAWTLLSTISDPDGLANDWFGYSVAIGDESSAAIGAPRADPAGVSDGGKVFRLTLFDSQASSLIYEVDSPRNTDDLFGWSVAMEGDTLVVGAEQDTGSAFGQGTVEVWGYPGGDDNYVRLATLSAPGAVSLDHFGYSVAISGDTVVVGAPDVDLASPTRENVGAAYVYVYNGSTYTFQTRLDRPGTAVSCENFGSSVAVSGEWIVVGSGFSASSCSAGGPNVSEIHEFGRSGTTWSLWSSFIPSDCGAGQNCRGAKVSLAGSLLTVGLPNEILGGVQTGTVKAYRRTTDGWSAFQRLGAPGLIANSRFGASVASGSGLAFAGVTGAPGQTGFAPILGPSPGDLVPAIGDGIEGNFGSASGGRHRLNRPYGMGYDGVNGRLMVADTYNNRIKEYRPDVDIVQSRVGNGTQGSAGDGSFAASAQLYFPTDVAVDGSGRIYIADWGNAKIRRVDTLGYISTLAGTGFAGYGGDGGPAPAAQLNGPYGIGLDAAGNVYVADYHNHRIRRIDAATNIITTIAGTGVAGYNDDGMLATAAQLNYPSDVAVAANGAVYIADNSNFRIRRIDPATNRISTVLGTGLPGYNGDNQPGASAQISYVSRLTVDSAGNLYVSDEGNNRLRRVAGGTGTVTTVAGTGTWGTAGDGGPATSAQIQGGFAAAVTPAGVFIAELMLHRIRVITPVGMPLTMTRAGTGLGSVSIAPPGVVCTTSCTNTYASGTVVTLVAAPATTSTFTGWSGDCTGTNNCTLTMSQPRNVTATFTGNPQLLTVNRTGSGTGTVTSNVAGISCGTDCLETYPYNTSVTLTPSPGANSIFSGWSGDCSGTGACTVSMIQPRSVTANFAQSTPPPTITTRSPSRGTTQGGTVVLLTGQNFVAGTTVHVGSMAVPVLLRGATELSFVTPRVTAPGVQTITVQTSSGQATTSFEYAAPIYETHTGWRRPSFAVDRYTAFETALPLLPEDTNGVSDVYVHDDANDTLRRVSISTAGREAIGGESTHAAISATGRFVAFESLASNLVYNDSNGLTDVFLHDRDPDENGVFDELGAITTTRASVSSTGAQATGGASTGASISGNGRFVAFQSNAPNLEAGDGNGVADVFVHDRLQWRTRRVSVATDGASAVAGTSLRPAISQNGRFVAFDSAAVLTSGDSNGVRDVFVHDRDLDVDGVMDEPGAVATRRISVSSAGAQAAGGDSEDASITGDGRYVVYGSTAANLVAGDTNAVSDVFLHDRDVDADGVFDEPGQIATRRASVGAGGAQFSVASGAPHISANGKLLVFLVANVSTGALTARGGLTAALGPLDGAKTTPWGQSDPINTDPPPPDKWTPGGPEPGPDDDDTDIEDATTSPDGDQRGGTDVTDEPRVIVHEEPPETIESPEIATISPAEGSTNGGTQVVIEGSDLAGTLYWNGTQLSPVTTSATRWTVLAPPRGGAPATVSLYFRDGDRRSNAESFTYITQSVPRWTDHAPRTGPVSGNVPLTITGSGFTSTTTVCVGREPATVTAWTATTLTVTLPPAYVAGPVSILITNPDGAEAGSNLPFTYQNAAEPVTLLRLEPAGASIVGGTAVTIHGTGFAEGTTVMFGSRLVTGLQRLSSRTLVAEAPAATPGPSEVQVLVPGQPPVSRAFDYAGTTVPVPACTGADADADGMDDAWEAQYGLAAGDSSDGVDDPDHDGLTSTQECQGASHPRGFYSRYLAEGATGQFFDTRIAIANPNASPARVLLRFQTSTGVNATRFLLVPPMSRRSVRPAQSPELASADVSTVIESDVEVVVDRTMLWGGGAATGLYGSHAESSLPTPRTEWYLAEGATHGNFDLFYLLQNPGPLDALVRIRYLRKAPLTPIERDYTVPGRRRVTIQVDAVPGLEAHDVSAVFQSLNDVPIIVERAMYATPAGARGFESGHDSAAIAAPATRWFLAEGATGVFFNTYLLLANPNPTAAAVTITYLLPGGRTVVRNHPVAGNSRATIHIADEAPELASAEMSSIVTVTNDVPIVVERSMWWPGTLAFSGNAAFRLFWGEAHNAPGATTTGTKWAVADGETGADPVATKTYYLIANTSAYAADVQVTLLSETDQAPMTRRFTVAANSRFTVSVADAFPATAQDGSRTYGAVIESLPVGGQPPAQIVVERAMYSNANELFWAAGSDLLGTRLR